MATGEFNMYDPASVFNKMIQAFYNISMTGETTFVPPVTQFSDANADGWFFTAISYLVHCGFIHGSPDGTPNSPIKRAQAVALLRYYQRRTPV